MEEIYKTKYVGRGTEVSEACLLDFDGTFIVEV